MKIKDFAALCDCSIYTLRYYDQIDLLKPKMVNEHSGYRYYTEDQIHSFTRIKTFQEIGFSVTEIKEMNDLSNYEIVKCIIKKIKYYQEQLDKTITILDQYIERSKESEKDSISMGGTRK